MTTETTETTEAVTAESIRDDLGVPSLMESFDIDSVDESDRERLADLIPDPRVALAYISRRIDMVRDYEMFAVASRKRYNVMLSGPTGSAKTTAARAYAAIHGLPFVSIPVNGAIDPGTVWGRYILGEDKSLVWIDSPAALVLRNGGVLVFDEINMAAPRVLAAFHELLDVRRAVTVTEHNGDVIRAHDNTAIIATMNPGYDGTARLNMALVRRFAWVVDWPYLAEVENVIIASETLRTFAIDVRNMADIRTDLSTDALVTFEDTASDLGVAFAAGRLVAGFSPSERPGVERSLMLMLPTIAEELGIDAVDNDTV